MARPDVNALRSEAERAVERGKLSRAIELYQMLERIEPTSATWPKRLGETSRRAGDNLGAVAALGRAAEKYVQSGFFLQAIAVCKVILQIDPRHSPTLTRLAGLAAASSTKPPPEPPGAQPPDPPGAPSPEAAAATASGSAQVPPQAPTAGARDAGYPRASTQGGVTARASRPPASQPMPSTSRSTTEPRPPPPPRPEPLRSGAESGRTRTPADRPSTPAAGIRVATRPAAPLAQSRSEREVVSSGSAPARPAEPPKAQRSSPPADPRPPERAASQPGPAPQPAAVDAKHGAAMSAGASDRPQYQNFATVRTKEPIFPQAPPPAMESAPAGVEARIEAALEEMAEIDEPRARPARTTNQWDGAPQLLIPKGSALDALDLATVVPGSKRQMLDGGTASGMSFVRLDEHVPGATLGENRAAVSEAGLAALRSTPLFAEISPAALEQLLQRIRLIELAPGEVLFHRGDVAVSMFVIAEGELTVEGSMRQLETLGPGTFLGEIALITDLPRSATARARTNTQLLEIDRDLLRTTAAESPEVVTVLLRFVRGQLVDRMTRTSDLFRGFTDAQRMTLAAEFDLVEIERDTLIVTQGDRIDGLYLMIAGQAQVSRDGAPFGQLAPGDVFGQASLLGSLVSPANVVATCRVLALRLPSFAFPQVIMTHPQVLAYLADLADRSAAADDFSSLLHIDLL